MAARWAKKRDIAERDIVTALRRLGATVLISDHPDLVVGYRGRTVLLEVKTKAKATHASRLTASQRTLFAEWRGGPLYVVSTTGEAIRAITDGLD